METIKYTYYFDFKNGRKEEFQIELDRHTLSPVKKRSADLPEWTKLEFQQCDSCPLSLVESRCPLAEQLSPLVDKLKDVVSIEEAKVAVTLGERVISSDTTAQEGISSIMGVITAVSGCPKTEFFKPMARFHLPFSNMEETFYRAASMYMLAQYYRWKNGMSADMDMTGLKQFYSNVASVNKYMAERLRANKREDGAINALVILDAFVKSVPYTIDTLLEEFEPLFEPYLRDKHIS
ncbi:MAG: hypothetical protein KAJ19_07825 [Gammaproteobacteria bacterium]|nr:hypothetical protein [Gammaproteobacteria bacterium]